MKTHGLYGAVTVQYGDDCISQTKSIGLGKEIQGKVDE
jgi:hypothetical protein